MSSSGSRARYVVCVDAAGEDDLQVRRIYRSLGDASAARLDLVRVVDDSGEDYLYPSRRFLPLQVRATLRIALERDTAAVRRSNPPASRPAVRR